MKSKFQSLITGLFLLSTAALSFAQVDVNSGTTNSGTANAGQVIVPEGGATALLLALGCAGLAIAAVKRFKRN